MKKTLETNWIITQSQYLARKYTHREGIVEAFLNHLPQARAVPGIRERLRREVLAIRLPVKRPMGLAVAAAACRALLGVVSLGFIAYLLLMGDQNPVWNGLGFTTPLSTSRFVVGLALVGGVVVAIQVLAEVFRLSAEKKADLEQTAAQIELFFEKGRAFVTKACLQETDANTTGS